MALTPIAPGIRKVKEATRGESSGAGLAGIIGAIAAGGAAALTGGFSLAAVPAIVGAAGGGAGLGQFIGNQISPGKAATGPQFEQTRQIPLIQQSKQFLSSIQSIGTMPDEIFNEFAPPLFKAYAKSQQGVA